MKNLLNIFTTGLICSTFFVSCQKQLQDEQKLGQTPTTGNYSTDALAEICPPCVANFTATTSTATTNAVFTKSGTVFTAAGTTLITIATTAQTYNVGNVIATVSHDANTIYFTLERNNPTGGFGNFRFYSPAVIPVPSSGPGNNGVPAGTTKIQIIQSRIGLPACEEISFSFSVGGGGNATVAGSVTTVVALNYVLRDLCPAACNIEIGDYRTQSQGFYLNSPNGAAFLNANPGLGPVTVGCAAGTTTNYTLADIISMVPGNSSLPGILVKQIITMTLNIRAAIIWNTGTDLGCLIVDDQIDINNPFNGLSVNQILTEANNLAGGCGSIYTEGQLADILGDIVDNFHEGTVNGGLLTCGTCL